MKSKIFRKILLASAAALVLVLSTPANAATSITACPYTITASGDYSLNADLSCASGGITIQASNVNLRLNTHRLDGAGSYTIGILVYSAGRRLSNVLIKGPGLVQHFADGIQFINVDNSQVDGVVFTNNLAGMETDTVTLLSVTNCVMTNNQAYGLLLGNSTGAQVTGNVLSSNGDPVYLGDIAAVFISEGGKNKVQQNTVVGNVNSGIRQESSTGNLIAGNLIAGNSGFGIVLSYFSGANQSGNQVQGNTALGNNLGDLYDASGGCDVNNWHNNTFITSNPSCIH